jgi:hypothetical protein
VEILQVNATCSNNHTVVVKFKLNSYSAYTTKHTTALQKIYNTYNIHKTVRYNQRFNMIYIMYSTVYSIQYCMYTCAICHHHVAVTNITRIIKTKNTIQCINAREQLQKINEHVQDTVAEPQKRQGCTVPIGTE